MADSLIPGNPGTIRGALIGLRINGNFVSCETACDFSFDVNMLAASTPDSGRWAGFIPGLRSWKMTVNMNLLLASVGADIKTVLQAVITGESVDLEFRTNMSISPHLIISGTAYPQTGGITAPGKGNATANVSFQGSGAFTCDFEQFWLIINAMPANSDKPVYIDTTQW